MRGFYVVGIAIIMVACTNSNVIEDPAGKTEMGGSGAVGGEAAGGTGGPQTSITPIVTLPDAAFISYEIPDGGEAKTCGMPNFTLDRSPVDVLIVMDISGSLENMVEGTGLSRWANQYPAVLKVVKATEKDIDWGLKMFPDKDGTQCLVRPGADVPVGPGNYQAIDKAITPLKPIKKPPGNGTPTGDAIHAGIAYLKSLKSTKPQYMVLATDGEPNCSVQGASDNHGEADIAAVKAAHDQGIDTFVIGVNDELKSNKILTGMAVAGGRIRAVDPLLEPPFYVAEDEAGLVKAMNEIAGKLASCLFSLGDQTPPSPNDVAADVAKKGSVITPDDRSPRDKTHTDGWDYTSDDHKVIEFYGSWCKKVQNIGPEGNFVRFTFGCPGISIP